MTEASRSLRTFSVLVGDLPGVLNRVASLFRRRCDNIDSLTVGRTQQPGISRMTIVAEADERAVAARAGDESGQAAERRSEDWTPPPPPPRPQAPDFTLPSKSEL